VRKKFEIKEDKNEYEDEEEIFEIFEQNKKFISDDSRKDYNRSEIHTASAVNNSITHSQTYFLSEINNNSEFSTPVTPPPSINIESSTSSVVKIINNSSSNLKKQKRKRFTSINTQCSESMQFNQFLSDILFSPAAPPPSPSNTF
jgi:hypothetical protein